MDVFKDPSGNAALRDFDYIDTETRLIGRVFHDFSRYLLNFAKGDRMTDAEQQSAVNQLVSRIDVALNVLGDLTCESFLHPVKRVARDLSTMRACVCTHLQSLERRIRLTPKRLKHESP